jgi:Subtilase family/SdrD B-like domain/Secretion system C-terminal sorting domain
MKKILFLLALSLIFLPTVQSQNKFGKLLSRTYPSMDKTTPQLILVTFTDKGAKSYKPEELLSPKAIKRRLKVRSSQAVIDDADFPLEQSYVKVVEGHVISLRHQLKWFNAVSAIATKKQIEELIHLPFVREIDLVGRWKTNRSSEQLRIERSVLNKSQISGATSFDYGGSYGYMQQINVPAVHDLGIYGQGVTICMFDEGVRSPSDPIFDSLNIISMHDFVDHKVSVIPRDPGAGGHGQATLTMLGGFASGSLIGPAFKANILLARTENDSSETPIEEDNWAKGIEWADSIGVDVTSTSLVYLGFDYPYPSMTWEDMDGVTALITRAGDRADSLGIVVVNAAGNSGRDLTHNTLCAPADGFNIITVGAVDLDGNVMGFSSNGPTVDGRIKPDVMAMGTGGTSIACPLAAGVAALILCANPSLTPAQVREAMKSTASNTSSPDNFHGWGILNALSAVNYFGITNHIAGSVFDDRNGNGKRDVDEDFITGLKVRLGGQKVDSVISDVHGRFLFDSLELGQYTISVDNPGPMIIKPGAGSYTVTLSNPHPIEGNLDFGFFRRAAIKGHLFLDRNKNGSFDPKDSSLSQWPIVLSGPISGTAFTDGHGNYSFTDLGPGIYAIHNNVPPFWKQTVPDTEVSFTINTSSGLDTTLPSFGIIFVPEKLIDIVSGWNMLSMPYREEPMSKDSLFSTSVSDAFFYNSNYQIKDTIAPGKGYWLKFPGPGNFIFTDIPVSLDTFSLHGGWNMIGSISYPVPVNSIESIPPEMTTSEFFYYMPDIGYADADTIRPGGGYWVKVDQAGQLVLSAVGAEMAKNIIRISAISEMPPPPPSENNSLTSAMPLSYGLDQNYPNPFNPNTIIGYRLPAQSHVTLKIFDVLGREVATLVNGIEEPGYKSVNYDAHILPSGVYFYRLRSGTFDETKKLILLR